MSNNKFPVSLSKTERQIEIQKLIKDNGRITVSQICENYHVSEATARRDLETLSEKGKLQRVHGGAINNSQAPPERPVIQRRSSQLEEKRKIGALAADLIDDGDIIFLGSGTTVHEVAKNIQNKRNLTVITNSLLVMEEFLDNEEVELINTGGTLRKSEYSFIGYVTEKTIKELSVSKVILGIRAISLEQGLTNDYLPETMTDRAIMQMGSELIIVADHTKFNRVSTVFVAPADTMNILVTSDGAPEQFLEALRNLGVDVLTA